MQNTLDNLQSINNNARAFNNFINNNNNNSDNSVRTDSIRLYTNCVTSENDKCNKEKNTTDSNVTITININIYRYKFNDDFTCELYKFSKIHQYDNIKDFKEAWEIWLEEKSEYVIEEVRRLTNLGYDGDIIDKMFKSARYYFRKKSTEKKAPQKRRAYHSVNRELLETMDSHITRHINDTDYKPSDGFDSFCKENISLLKEEINILCKNGFTDAEQIKQKIKKTYKNRYFILINK